MSFASYQQAVRAQTALSKHLTREALVERVVVGEGEPGYFVVLVEVTRATPHLLGRIPDRIGGIPVLVFDLSVWNEIWPENRAAAKECPCKVTMRVLAALGAEKTARMHARSGDEWTDQEWLDHFEEEERILLPILIERRLSREAYRIATEHKVMLRYKQKNGVWPMDALMEHAAYEDYLVANFLGDLDPLRKKARKTLGKVAAEVRASK